MRRDACDSLYKLGASKYLRDEVEELTSDDIFPPKNIQG